MKRIIKGTKDTRFYLSALFCLFGSMGTVVLCVLFCIETNVLAYRMAAIFLSLICISNLSARFAWLYFERK